MLMQSKMRPKGLFGAFAPGMQDVTPQTIPGAEMGLGMANMVNSPAPAPKGPGFFGQGGFGRAMAGYLGDMLMQQSGFQPLYAPMMQNRAEAEAKARAQQDQRDYEWSKWLKQKEWEKANPDPINNDTVNDYQFIMQTAGPEAAQKYLEGRYDPIVNVQLPGGAVYSGPRSGLQSALGNAQAPQQPQPTQKGGIARPATKADYDKLPPGSQYMDPNGVLRTKPGGASSNAGGNFPGR